MPRTGPTFEPRVTENALKVMKKQKYLWHRPDGSVETPKEMYWRVASTVAAAEANWGATKEQIDRLSFDFYDVMAENYFIPNTPTLVNAGKPDGQLAACFVLPIEDEIGPIYDTLKAQALIQKSGGGTGFSGARIRCKDSPIGGTSKKSDGSNVFLELYNFSSFKVLRQGATRKGANMWVLPIWHADVEDFIEIKKTDGNLSEFNISVAITDEFMEACAEDKLWELKDPKDMRVVKTVRANDLMNKIIDYAWLNGEPGLLFIDQANRHNPTPSLGAFEATNPCGEQWLLPWEACTLGHINLSKLKMDDSFHIVNEASWERHINWTLLEQLSRVAVRFLDNVVEINSYPLPQIEKMHKLGNRKIGVGVLGFADLLIMLGVEYDSKLARTIADKIGAAIERATNNATEQLAVTRGCFANFNQSVFTTPRRNACVRTVAPTGSTSVIAGSKGGGIEPIFGLVIVRDQAGMKMYEVNPTFEAWLLQNYEESKRKEIVEYVGKTGTIIGSPHVEPELYGIWKQANDISPSGHILMQAEWQKHVDNSISKTINFANSATKEQVREAYMLAWEHGCKGVTVYRDGSRQGQVLNQAATQAAATTKSVVTSMDIVDLFTRADAPDRSAALSKMLTLQNRDLAPKVDASRDSTTHGSMRKIPTGCGNSVIYIGRGKDGKVDDVVGKLGKSGGCASAWWEGLGRVVSIALRHGVESDEIRKQLVGISCHLPAMYLDSPLRRQGDKPPTITSCADALAMALLEEDRDNALKTPIFLKDGTLFDEAPPPSTWVVGEVTTGPYVPTTTVSNRKHMGACPDCGSSQLDRGSGCLTCRSCGFSMC